MADLDELMPPEECGSKERNSDPALCERAFVWNAAMGSAARCEHRHPDYECDMDHCRDVHNDCCTVDEEAAVCSDGYQVVERGKDVFVLGYRCPRVYDCCRGRIKRTGCYASEQAIACHPMPPPLPPHAPAPPHGPPTPSLPPPRRPPRHGGAGGPGVPLVERYDVPVVERLNTQFLEGVPSNDLSQAGIIVHQFDGNDDENPAGKPWVPGSGHNNFWSDGYVGDRISVAIVNGNMIPDPPRGDMVGGNVPIYSFSLGGLLLSPTRNSILCGYPYDVGSIDRTCTGHKIGAATFDGQPCVPGCTWAGYTHWCQPWVKPNDMGAPCACKPTALKQCMEARDTLASREVKPRNKVWDDNK